MRLVLDTNIVISGLIWGGVPRQFLDLANENQLSLFCSNELLIELEEVLQRKKFAEILASQSISPELIVNGYRLLTTRVKPLPISRTVRDPDDDIVLATALAARADAIVTGDKDLLVLHPYEAIPILSPEHALHLFQTQRA